MYNYRASESFPEDPGLNDQRQVGLNLFMLKSALVFASKMADRFATPITEGVGLIFSEPVVMVLVKEGLFVRFPGLPVEDIKTRRAAPLELSASRGPCGIKLDRRLLAFSFRTGPMFDRRLAVLLLAEDSTLAFPVEGARRFGDPGKRSRTLGTCRFPSLEVELSVDPILFMLTSDKGLPRDS